MDGSSFTKSKLMEFPRHVLVGHDVLGDAGRFCRDLALEGPATLVVGRKTRKIAGDAVASSLEADGVKVQSIEVRGATRASVAAVDRQVRETHSRFLLGVGGGSVIDVAKLAAAEASLSFVSVPTTASHDGITSPRASIEEERGKASLQAHAPVGILADTHVIVKAPYRTLAAGCADVISNSTAVLDWKLAHRLKGEEYSSFAAVLAETAAEMMIENAGAVKPNLEDSCWIVVKSLIVSGTSMSVAGSSRPASGAEHMVSHTLDRLAPGRALHGEQCGLASILTMHLHGGDWQRLRDALATVGAPTTAKELGIPAETIVEALSTAHLIRPDRYTILGDSGMSREAAWNAVRTTRVA